MLVFSTIDFVNSRLDLTSGRRTSTKWKKRLLSNRSQHGFALGGFWNIYVSCLDELQYVKNLRLRCA